MFLSTKRKRKKLFQRMRQEVAEGDQGEAAMQTSVRQAMARSSRPAEPDSQASTRLPPDEPAQVTAAETGSRTRTIADYLMTTLVLAALVVPIIAILRVYLDDQPEPEALISGSGPVERGMHADPYEDRFERLEQMLRQSEAKQAARLRQLEERLLQATGPYETRLKRVEEQSLGASAPSSEQLLGIEKMLIHVTARLDTISSALETLSGNSSAIMAVNETTRIEPPAAMTNGEDEIDQDRPQGSEMTAAVTPPVEAVITSFPGEKDAILSPAPAPGEWVVNIASYAREGMANRKLAAFRDQGVTAEIHPASVNGRTMYRVGVAGFDSLAAARAGAPAIKQQLGLDDVWISRR